MLESLGYRTLQAGNGAEALKTAGAFPGRIHLVISDIVMPRMSGRRLVQELRKVRNDFHVLFVSGYSEDESVNDERPAAEAPVLQKPFTRGVLARKTREILDGGNA
jgi:CheY-like chemotaxis protein